MSATVRYNQPLSALVLKNIFAGLSPSVQQAVVLLAHAWSPAAIVPCHTAQAGATCLADVVEADGTA